MDLLIAFEDFIHSKKLFHPKDKLLVAVSGGADSVVLCELCRQSGFDFTIAHCNFQLRGEESDRDERFVRELANKYGKEVLVKRFDTETYAKDKKVSIQVAARELRYGWFNELLTRELPAVRHGLPPDSYQPAGRHGRDTIHDSPLTTPHYLVTAHHLNDSLETLVMNFFKGTGIAGLHGILPKQGKIVRPLLFAKKDELIAFANENRLKWVEDSSNESDKYSRNYFRHQVIPLIQKIYPGAENNLAANLDRFRDIELLYQQAIAWHKKKLIEQKGNEFHIPVLKLKKSVPLHSIVYEILKDFGFHSAQVDEVIDLLNSDSGKYIASSSHRVIKNRNWLIIAPVAAAEAETILIEEGAQSVEFGPDSDQPAVRHGRVWSLNFEQLTSRHSLLTTDHSIAFLDSKEIRYPLILRKWKTGDYFYPLGMKKKKKLARFFIDQKLSKTDKEKIWVLEMNKKIIWVIGQRIDDRFKVTDKTEQLLKITSSL